MRLTPNRYAFPDRPVVVKKQRALLSHLSPPVKGLMDDAKSAEADPKFASILTNLYVNDDRLTCRAGFAKIANCGSKPVEHLIPYYGEPNRLAAATNLTLCDAQTGLLLKAGFTSNDWHWTMHSDLGATERTVICNGADGVWSWDGLQAGDVGPVTITKIAKNTITGTPPATDAIVTVGSADIAKFHNYDPVIVSGADVAHSAANGPQRIAHVGDVANTFTLIGVDTTNWGGDQTTGTMRVVLQGSFTLEAVKPPKGNTWLQVNDLAIVVAHQNRLFFADESNLAAYYLPVQQRYGELAVLPLNAIFRRGGIVKAMATWTVDGGMGMDDQLVIFSSNGEIAIWSGVDPATDFTLVGVFRMEAPMSKWSVTNYGGELYFLNPTGLTPMSTVIRSGREGLEATDKTVVARFQQYAFNYRNNAGWELQFNPNSGRAMCNLPMGGGKYVQMMRNMAKPSWGEWKGVPSRCWGWIEPYLYFGDDLGNVYHMHPTIQSDDGLPIQIDVQTAWSQYKTPAIKHFKMILPYILTDGSPKPAIDLLVDFDTSTPKNVPDISEAGQNDATWDVSSWAASDAEGETAWVYGSKNWTNWTGVGSIGRVGAVRMTAAVYNCSFSILGWDVLYDRGSVFG
jgi:hypothetical protein